MSVESTREVMMRYLEAHDESMLDQHAVLTIMATGYEARGREAIGRLVHSFYHGVFEAQYNLKDMLIADGQACFEAEAIGRLRSEFVGIAPSGEEVHVPFCVVYELGNDLITQGRIYFETDVLRQQIRTDEKCILKLKIRGVFLAETKEESMAQQATSERMLGIGILASLIAGLIAGISARIIMRIVALTAHMPPGFSIAGTLNIVFLGFILGFIAGFIYTGCVVALSSTPKVSKHLPGPLWRGLAFGVLLLVIGGLPGVLIPLLPIEDLNLGIPLLNRSMFVALPLIYGITLGGAEALLERSLPRKPASPVGGRSSPQLNEEEQIARKTRS